MTISELGSLGELVAAVATVATLVYLATQIRQNTRALRSSTIESLVDQMTASVQVMVTSDGLADLFLRAEADYESLTPAEQSRHTYTLLMIVRRFESVFFQRVLEHLGQEGWELITLERRQQGIVYLYLKRAARS